MTKNEIAKFASDNDLSPELARKAAFWIGENAYNFQDRWTSEINCTGLAAGVADELNLYEDDSDYVIPEWVFDLAILASK